MAHGNTPHSSLSTQPPGSCCRNMAAWPTRKTARGGEGGFSLQCPAHLPGFFLPPRSPEAAREHPPGVEPGQQGLG